MDMAPAEGMEQSWRAVLRARTTRMHQQAELAMAGTEGFRSAPRYRGFLQRIERAHRQFGLPAARAVGTEDDVAEEHGRYAAVCRDLGQAEHPCPGTPAPSAGYAWGVGYVLNGSALGASSILRDGQFPAGHSVGYLEICDAYVRGGGLKRFFDRLNVSGLDLDDATRGAEDVFAVFARA